MHKKIQFFIIFIQILINTTNIFASQTAIHTNINLTRIQGQEKNQSMRISDFNQNSYIKLTKDDYYNTIHQFGYPFLNRMIEVPLYNKSARIEPAIIYPEMIKKIRGNFLPPVSLVENQLDENIKNLDEYTLFNGNAGFQLYPKVDTTKNTSSLHPYIDIHIDSSQLQKIQPLLNQNKFCAISTKDCNDTIINVKITEITDEQISPQFMIQESNQSCNSQLEATILRFPTGKYKLYINQKKTADKTFSFNEISYFINLSEQNINTLQENYNHEGEIKQSDHPCILMLKKPNNEWASFDINRILKFEFQESKTETKTEINYFVIGTIALILAIPSFIYLIKIFLHKT